MSLKYSTRDISLKLVSYTQACTQEYVCFSDFAGLKPYLKDYDYDYSEYSKKSVDYGDKKVWMRMQAFAELAACFVECMHHTLAAAAVCEAVDPLRGAAVSRYGE